MKIVHVADSPGEIMNGCYFDRLYQPAEYLREKGHEVKTLFIRNQIEKEWIDYGDIFVLTRWYNNTNPMDLVNILKKNNIKIVYELDDDVWKVPDVNPTKDVSVAKRDQCSQLAQAADLVTVTTDVLKKRLEDFNDNVKVIPNAIDKNRYDPPSNASEDDLRIVWSGSVTHYADLNLCIDALVDLQKKHHFKFILQGISSQPLAAEMYTYNVHKAYNKDIRKQEFFERALGFYNKLGELEHYQHTPFYPPEMHANVMKNLNGDIGICPLVDNEFNHSKSANKFYQYAGLGMATLASDVIPYNKVMDYTASNTYKDWKEKLEKLITDEEFRKELAQKQRKYVLNNRTLDVVVDTLEDTYKQLINK